MLHVTIIAVGGLKEKYFTGACGEYAKRLGSFCKLSIVEVEEYRLPKEPSAAQIERCLLAEGAAILKKLPPKAAAVPLCIEGERLSSRAFSEKLAGISGEYPHAAFVIGGSHGISEEGKARGVFRLSMSEMTFPHQLSRVMLLEQLYRGFSILNGMKYHK